MQIFFGLLVLFVIYAATAYALRGRNGRTKAPCGQFNPAQVPNELMPSTWRNGPYQWDPELRAWLKRLDCQ